jgi:hypothetical protein
VASVTIQLLSVCAGGDHATVRLTKGAQVRDVQMLVADLRTTITQDDIEAFCKVALKLHNEGKTLAQFKSSVQAGVTVTV